MAEVSTTLLIPLSGFHQPTGRCTLPVNMKLMFRVTSQD